MEHKLVYAFPQRLENTDGALSLHWAHDENPFAATRQLEQNNALQTVRIVPSALSAEECRQVIAMGEAARRAPARTEFGENIYRVSHIAWLEPAPANHWLFHRLGMQFLEAANYFGMKLDGFADALQYTEYGAGERFDWHMDLGPYGTSLRKLSMTLQLSDEGEYGGGALEFINMPGLPPARPVGTAIFFPSYLVHRVSPIESGRRRSLVAWACGPAFA